jgi:Phosphoinositide phospholipase C, Ca2+-dependent
VMKRWLGVPVVAGVVLVGAAGVGVAKTDPYPLDKVLRVNHVQVLGTHNSYHVRPTRNMAADDASNYAHPPLDQQLESGIRSLEIDVQNGPGFPVYHSIIVDQSSNCATLEACLMTIAAWSSANPGHVPITVFVELKELPAPNPNAIVQQVVDDFVKRNNLAPWDAAALDRLDAVVRAAFGNQLVTPDEVRGKHATLRAAITSSGWPTLAKTRGRVMVIFNSRKLRETYLAGNPSGQGRPMFVIAPSATRPSAAFVSVAVPDAARIGSLLRQHMMIRTEADANGVEARSDDRTRATNAIESGAQVVATDYPLPDPTVGPYVVKLPTTAIARCDPVTAPKRCRDRDVENPAGLANP